MTGSTPEGSPARALPAGGLTAVGLGLLPLALPDYYLIELSYALVYAIACPGLNLLYGTTGLLSLGHAAFFGVGAYTGGFLYYFGPLGSLEAFLLAGVLGATALAAVLGFLCVRATRIHFTILTLAFGQMVHAVFVDGAVFGLFGSMGKGLYFLYEGGLYIPRFTILGREIAPEPFIPALYYVILAAFGASAWLLWRISRSPFGKALRAIRDNETRAACIGLPLRRYRWYAFIISGAFVGLAGGLHGQLDRQITTEHLDWLYSAELILVTVLGGTRHFAGPILGAVAFEVLHTVASPWIERRGMVLGLLLIAVVFAFPGGMAGSAMALGDRLRRAWRGAR